ncbi:MAG: ribonuclease HI [Alphaproteobacteria bacterium]
MDKVDVYTDGGCSGNPGPGGWGAIVIWNGTEKELSGYAPNTTNNRMEMTAVLEALTFLKRHCHVTVHTDSQYVQKGMTEWLKGWKAKGWRSSTGAVANVDLWQALDKAAQQHTVTWTWIRGHSGHPYNERADKLAVAAYQKRA